MKKPFPLTLGLLLPLWLLVAAPATQAQSWAWAQSPGAGQIAALAGTSDGDVVVAGYSGDFSSGRHAFVQKLTGIGAEVWNTPLGGPGTAFGVALAVDSAGDIYLTGSFRGPVVFGTTTLTPPSGNYDLFVAKLSAQGQWRWAVQVGADQDESGKAIGVDAAGNAYVSGFFRDTVATFGATTLHSHSSDNAFVAKISPAGAWQWAVSTSASAPLAGAAFGVAGAVDNRGYTIVAGWLSGSVAFGATTLTSTGATDLFVARVTPTGTWEWATGGGGNDYDFPTGVALAPGGDVVVSGLFYGSTQFGTTTLPSAGSSDGVLARLSGTGAWLSARRMGGAGLDAFDAVAVEGSGQVIVTGRCAADTLRLGGLRLPRPDTANLFVAKLAPDGTGQWALGATGTTPLALLSAVGLTANGAVLVAGRFTRNALTLGATTMLDTASRGESSIVIARVDQPLGMADERAAPSRFHLTPNPAHGSVRLTGLPPGTTTAHIIDALGRTVRTAHLEPLTSNLDLTGLPPGLYVVRVGGLSWRLVVE